MEFGIGLQDLVSWGVVGCLLAYIGSKAVPVVRKLPESRWRTLYLATAWMHPIIAGGLIGLCESLPVPAGMGDGWAGSILWYALSGALGLYVYRILVARLEARAKAAAPPPRQP